MTAAGQHLRLVGAPTRAAEWRVTPDEDHIELVVGSEALCKVSPWTDNKTGDLVWWGATGGERYVEIDQSLAVVMQKAAVHFAVDAPVTAEFLASMGEQPLVAPLPKPKAEAITADTRPLLERFAELLAAILDDPLVVLPGSHPGDTARPTEIRLAHFRPDLSERAAILLEEAGR